MIDIGDLTILVIEDDEDDRDLVTAQLERLGVGEVRARSTLASALETMDPERPASLILVDLTLPDSRDVATVRRLRDRSVESPIVVLTANRDIEIGESAMRGGADDFLIKGEYTSHELERCIRFSVERHRRSLELERLTVELEQANARLEELATTDALTGLANRREFERSLAEEWRRCGRLRLPLTLILVDADHFKQINDSLGHDRGDAALTLIASAIRRCTRRALDLGCRIGGDEFALILSGTDERGAAVAADRLLQEVRASSFERPLSITAGLATTVPDRARDHLSLYRDADRALLESKRAGRGRWSRAPRSQSRENP